MSGPALVLNPQVPAVDPSNGTTISLGTDGKLQISVGGTAPVDVGGGGSGTVHTDGTTITGDGSIGNPLVAAAQFGTNVILQQPDSIGTQVTTLQLINDLLSNTHGAVTSEWLVKFQLLGQLVQLSLSAANLAGRQSVTTSGSTPSVAWNPRSDELKITLGANVTSLTVTGLDLATDGGYDIEGLVTETAAAEVDISLNGTSTATLRGGFFGASYAQALPTVLIFADANPTSTPQVCFARLRQTAAGSTPIYQVTMSCTGRFWESYTGFSSVTANVTSLAFNAMSAGTIITLRRPRVTTY